MQLADFLPRFLQEELHVPQLVLWICVSRHSLLPRGEVSQPRLVRPAHRRAGTACRMTDVSGHHTIALLIGAPGLRVG